MSRSRCSAGQSSSGRGPSRRSPRVKICGITRPEDARRAVELGADYLGLNFYEGSPRCIDVVQARAIRAAVGDRVPLVGVFVNHARGEVETIASQVGLDLIQFHGDEAPEEVAFCASRAIKAFRASEEFDAKLLEGYGDCWGWLFDSPHPTLYGGTAQSWSYTLPADLSPAKRIFLAGGLGPDNVSSVLAKAQVFAVDVSSGVESSPGIKDATLLERFFSEVRNAQDRNGA